MTGHGADFLFAEVLSEATKQVVSERTNGSDRSRQSKSNVLGVSDIGKCHEYVRRMIVGEEPSQEVDRYDLAAFVGTAIGDHMEDAWIATFPDEGWVKQAEVTVELTVRGFNLNIPGHPDLYKRDILIDFKSKDGLGVIRRTGPSEQERYQRVLYAKALIEKGEMDEACTLANVYIDRSGDTTEPVVWAEPYSEAIVEEAIAWIDDVMYAVIAKEEAMRDPSREWCWACCPFAPACRGEQDTDVEGKLTDPEVVEAIRMHVETSEQIKALTKDKKSAESVLREVNGRTDTHTVRNIDIPGGEIKPGYRSGYTRLDIRPIRKAPARKRKEAP